MTKRLKKSLSGPPAPASDSDPTPEYATTTLNLKDCAYHLTLSFGLDSVEHVILSTRRYKWKLGDGNIFPNTPRTCALGRGRWDKMGCRSSAGSSFKGGTVIRDPVLRQSGVVHDEKGRRRRRLRGIFSFTSCNSITNTLQNENRISVIAAGNLRSQKFGRDTHPTARFLPGEVTKGPAPGSDPSM